MTAETRRHSSVAEAIASLLRWASKEEEGWVSDAYNSVLGIYNLPPYWIGGGNAANKMPALTAMKTHVTLAGYLLALGTMTRPEEQIAYTRRPAGEVLYPALLFINQQTPAPVPLNEQMTALRKRGPDAEQLKRFVVFFWLYWAEWTALDEAERNQEDITGAQQKVFHALVERGLVRRDTQVEAAKPEPEAEPETPLEAIAEVLDNAQVYATMLHRPGLDELTLLNRNNLEVKKHETTGHNSIISGSLTIQEDFDSEISLLPSTEKEMGIQERQKHFDELFQVMAKRLSSVAAMKWLDTCFIQLGRQNKYKAAHINTLVAQPLEEIMELWGIPKTKASMDKLRRTLRDVQEAFYSISLSYEENLGNGKKEPVHQRILQKRSEIKNNINYARFTEEITHYICRGYPSQFPLSLLKVDERNPNVYAMGRYLANRYSNIKNQQEGIADIISVKALLKIAPAIPSFQEVEAAGERQVKQRIMRPFRDAMNKLDFLTWEYCNAKKEPLRKGQHPEKDYEAFIECYIHYELLNTKDYRPLIAAREEKKAADKEKREARAAAGKKTK